MTDAHVPIVEWPEEQWVDVPIGTTAPVSARAVRRLGGLHWQYIPKQEEQ